MRRRDVFTKLAEAIIFLIALASTWLSVVICPNACIGSSTDICGLELTVMATAMYLGKDTN